VFCLFVANRQDEAWLFGESLMTKSSKRIAKTLPVNWLQVLA